MAPGVAVLRRRVGRGPSVLPGPGLDRPRREHGLPDGVGAAGPARRGRALVSGGGARRGLARRDPAPRRDLGRTLVHRNRIPRRLLHQLPPVPAGLPGAGAGPVRQRGGPAVTAEVVVFAPLRVEAAAVRGAAAGARVVRTGMGRARATRAVRRLAGEA